jgi:adenine phosphoribosyltransferase
MTSNASLESPVALDANPSLRIDGLIRTIPDFPRPGILFKDITPVLADHVAMREVIDAFNTFARALKPTVVIGIESRGFVLGMPVALDLGVGFVPVRKLGKLPYKTISESYELEYGTNTLEIHEDAIVPGDRVLITDDLLATGGTAGAAARLVERLGGTVVGFAFMIELGFLSGRAALPNYSILSLVNYE